MKTIIVIALVAVLLALAGAGFFMLRKDDRVDGQHSGRDKRMATALAVRVGLSVAVFLFILLSWWMGWVQPNGLPMAR